MKSENIMVGVLQKLLYGVVGFAVAYVGIMGYYPLIPAYYGTYCLTRQRNYLVYVGMLLGMFLNMSFQPFMKYILIMGVINVGIRFYWWANRNCGGWIAGIIAGVATAAMNLSCAAMLRQYGYEMTVGIGEGFFVAGATVFIHYAIEMTGQIELTATRTNTIIPYSKTEMSTGKTEAFAVAVEELSNAFKAMDVKSNNVGSRKVELLEQEITGRLCACCEECTVCWNDNRYSLSDSIRRMIMAAIAHDSKEELCSKRYVDECSKYKSMVSEAIEAVGRVELNEAWHKRLQENRLVVAGQLNAMSELLHGWSNECKNCDDGNRTKIARIIYESKERGILTEEVHIYEDKRHRIRISAVVAGKWNGGIPMKNYRIAVEKAMGIDLRVQKESKSIITKNAELVCLYEETNYYTLPGIATQRKSDSPVSGDSFVMFDLDSGNYNICLSDGMGSGNDARRESETVVDLMEKFMEAGFEKETAVKLMNSAMVLQGTKESYSTLDYAQIDLYDAELEVLKVGAAASFLKRADNVEAIISDTLPAGFDVNQELCSIKKSLQHGDFLVMVTDGVLEYLHVENPEDKLSEIIREIRTDNAGVLAKSILENVLTCTGGYAIDDMTVLVTGIWEK